MTKKIYEVPAIASLGSFEDLTQSNRTGVQLDQTFPAGTPLSDLTVS